MDQYTFHFATRGHCIKGIQRHPIAIGNKKIICIQSNLANFPSMQTSLVANWKAIEQHKKIIKENLTDRYHQVGLPNPKLSL